MPCFPYSSLNPTAAPLDKLQSHFFSSARLPATTKTAKNSHYYCSGIAIKYKHFIIFEDCTFSQWDKREN